MSRLPYPDSLCHRCGAPPKYVRTATSTFLRCPILPDKYPRQPVHACAAFIPPVVETARLVLRRFVADDLDFLASLVGDPEVMRYYPAVEDRDGARRQLERIAERDRQDGYSVWLAVDKASGEPIGRVGLMKQTLGPGETHAEVGYMIRRDRWRQGYAFEAAAGVRDWAFAHGLDHVIALVRPENTPSAAVAGKLGMQPGPVVQFHGLDHVVWRLDRSR